jgi:transcriptional antiterminator NusG
MTNPYDLPGKWYVLNTKANHENKVKQAIETRAKSMMVDDRIYDIHIPVHDVTEIKKGKKQTVEKKTFPGYLLVRCDLNDECYGVLRHTPGVTGFLGGSDVRSDRVEDKATPLTRREVERFVVFDKDDVDIAAPAVIDFELDELVTINEGPFSGFNGQVIDINADQLTLKVLVNIFGRETPVEIGFGKVTKT